MQFGGGCYSKLFVQQASCCFQLCSVLNAERRRMKEAIEQKYQVHFSDAAVPNKLTIFLLVYCFRETGSTNDTERRFYTNMLKRVELCLQQG
jgi:hypothetical protein